MASVN